MLKKKNERNSSGTFSKTIIHLRATRPFTFKLYHLRTEANQNVHGTDVEQRKESKKKAEPY
jgi:hypothetical protein